MGRIGLFACQRTAANEKIGFPGQGAASHGAGGEWGDRGGVPDVFADDIEEEPQPPFAGEKESLRPVPISAGAQGQGKQREGKSIEHRVQQPAGRRRPGDS